MPRRQILYPIKCSYHVQSNLRLQNKSHYIPVRDVAAGVFWVEWTCSFPEPPELVTGISAQQLIAGCQPGASDYPPEKSQRSWPTELLMHNIIQMRYNHFRQHLMLICRTLKSMKRDDAFCSVCSGMTIRTSHALRHPECWQNKHLCDPGTRRMLQNSEEVPGSQICWSACNQGSSRNEAAFHSSLSWNNTPIREVSVLQGNIPIVEHPTEWLCLLRVMKKT